MPRLGTIRPTPRLGNARRTRKRRMETPPVEQRHPLRMADRKNRIHTSQPERPEHDQHRRPKPRTRHANRTGQNQTSPGQDRDQPWRDRLHEAPRQRKNNATPQNHSRPVLRESRRQDQPSRRTSRTPTDSQTRQRRLIPNGPIHRTLPAPNPRPTQRPAPRPRSRIHRETDLDSPSACRLSDNGRDPHLRCTTHRRSKRPVRTTESHIRQPARNTSRARNRPNSHSRTNTPSPIRLQDDQRRLHQPQRQSTLHRRQQSTLSIHDPIRTNRIHNRRSIQRHQPDHRHSPTTQHTGRFLHTRPTPRRRNSHNPPRRDAPEKMGLRKRHKPLHRSRRLPLHRLGHHRTNQPRLRQVSQHGGAYSTEEEACPTCSDSSRHSLSSSS